MIVAIYTITTGEILRRFSGPADHVTLQCGDGEDFYLNSPPDATHIIDNEPVTIVTPDPPPTEEQVIATLSEAVQRHLDTTARQRNYDGILSLCSYATSTDPVFAAEGQAGVEFRDSCWRACYEVMAAVKAGNRSIPTEAELMVELPDMVWPTLPI